MSANGSKVMIVPKEVDVEFRSGENSNRSSERVRVELDRRQRRDLLTKRQRAARGHVVQLVAQKEVAEGRRIVEIDRLHARRARQRMSST